MSLDDLTITLRGEEAYDYLQWRAERYKEETEEGIRRKAAVAADRLRAIAPNPQSVYCENCEYYSADSIVCKRGLFPPALRTCPGFEPKNTPPSPC